MENFKFCKLGIDRQIFIFYSFYLNLITSIYKIYYNNNIFNKIDQTKLNMEPKSKYTRSKNKIGTNAKQKQKRLPKKIKQIHKGKEYYDQIKRIKKQKQKDKLLKNEQIVVNMNLGKYGFDEKSNSNKIEEIQKLIQLCLSFSINPNIEELEWKDICKQITNRLKMDTYLLQNKNRNYLLESQSQNLIEVSKMQHIIWQCAHQLLLKIKQGSSSPGLAGVIKQHVQLVGKFLKNVSIEFQKINDIENWRNIQKINDLLIQERSLKTFRLGLGDYIIDQLNYFLQRQINENSRIHNADFFIGNWLQWADFIQRKRVRLRKANKFLLHTACQLCLSPYVEQSNQMIYCPECHMRGHKACLELNTINRCGRCIYLRLSNQMKSKVPECFICGVKGLMPLRINSSKFVHVFCIIAHNLWYVQHGKINMKQQNNQQNQLKQNCKFCLKQSVYCTNCDKCKQPCHFLCAFMNGSCFAVEDRKINVTCCQLNSVSGERLAYQRKYILNYENIVFKKLNQIKKVQGIQKSRGRYRIKTKPKKKMKKGRPRRFENEIHQQIILSEDQFRLGEGQEKQRRTKKYMEMDEEYQSQEQ